MVNRTTTDTYFVLKKAVNRKKQLRSSLLSLLDQCSVNETGQNKMGDFLMYPEVSLFMEAAGALGKTGVQGQENEPAMVIYTQALRFSKLMQDNDDEDTGSGADEIMDDTFSLIPTERRQKKRSFNWQPMVTCANSGRRCFMPCTCPIGRFCHGMCGPGCSECWRWVCGHCCFSRATREASRRNLVQPEYLCVLFFFVFFCFFFCFFH